MQRVLEQEKRENSENCSARAHGGRHSRVLLCILLLCCSALLLIVMHFEAFHCIASIHCALQCIFELSSKLQRRHRWRAWCISRQDNVG